MTYTIGLSPGIEFYRINPGTEEDTWGDLLNINQDRLVQAAQGVLTKDVTGVTSWTLDDTDFTGTESHYKAIFLFGTMSADLEILFPLGKQRAVRMVNFTTSNSSSAPRAVTLKIVGNAGPAGFNSIPLVHGDRISFMLREDGSLWIEFQASKFLEKFNPVLTAPLDANGQPITNLPYPSVIDGRAAQMQWVVDYVNSAIATNRVAEWNRIYPVGSCYIHLTNAANPATYLGFGTWVPWGGGTVMVCAGIGTDTNGESINLSGAADRPPIGTYFSRLSQANLPPVNVETTNPGDNAGGFSFLEASSAGGHGITTIPLGSAAPFLNLPPISVAYVWRRTA